MLIRLRAVIKRPANFAPSLSCRGWLLSRFTLPFFFFPVVSVFAMVFAGGGGPTSSIARRKRDLEYSFVKSSSAFRLFCCVFPRELPNSRAIREAASQLYDEL